MAAKGYTEDEWNEAIAKLNNSAGSRPGYTSSYDTQMQELLDKYRNREKFSYDLGSDALYKQLADKYQQQGKLAMKDSMGQAAGLTGGYGSSYGEQVGQQSYDAYLQNLNDVVPDLYDAAYGRYQDEGNQMLTEYNLLGDLANNEYSKYRDSVSDWQYDEQQRRNDEQTAYERQKYEEESAYDKQQTAYKNLYALILATGYNPSAEELTAAGMSQKEAQALIGKYISDNITPDSTSTTTYSSGGSSSGGSYPSTAPDGRDARTVQAELRNMGYNISVDGAWGPKSQAAWDAAYGGGGSGNTGANSNYEAFINQLEGTSSRSERRALIKVAKSNGIIDANTASQLERLYNH